MYVFTQAKVPQIWRAHPQIAAVLHLQPLHASVALQVAHRAGVTIGTNRLEGTRAPACASELQGEPCERPTPDHAPTHAEYRDERTLRSCRARAPSLLWPPGGSRPIAPIARCNAE